MDSADTESALLNGAPGGNLRYGCIYRIIYDFRTLYQMISLVFVIKKFRINMSPIFDGYRVMAA